MSTTLIMYMPGHAGNFVQRLFGLSPEFIPALERTKLFELVDNWKPLNPQFDKLSSYRFSNVPVTYRNWQHFHRSYADYLDWKYYRWLNLICGLKYDFVYALHPHEFDAYFLEVDDTNFYYIDLDPKYNSWVEQERAKLKFVWRNNEQQQFEELKQQYTMKPISLTALISDQLTFANEYLRVCAELSITPNVKEAIELRQDWQSVRLKGSQ